MSDYSSLSGFEDVYLEDTWVLEIQRTGNKFVFHVDLVLTSGHADYVPPLSGEQYCYRRARIVFDDLRSLDWTGARVVAAQDSTGEFDLGTIDFLGYADSKYSIEGDFGSIVLVSSAPRIEFTDRSGSRSEVRDERPPGESPRISSWAAGDSALPAVLGAEAMTKHDVSFHADALLSIQGAMLDLVLPTLRGVAVEVSYPNIRARFVYESIGWEEKTATDDAEAFASADFNPPVEVVCTPVEVPTSLARTAQPGEVWIFRRYEEATNGPLYAPMEERDNPE